jgi:hypothetical protein
VVTRWYDNLHLSSAQLVSKKPLVLVVVIRRRHRDSQFQPVGSGHFLVSDSTSWGQRRAAVWTGVAWVRRVEVSQWRGWLGIDGTVALSKPTARFNGVLDGPVVNLEADPIFQELMAEGLAMQHRFAAEPIFAKTGKGFLISEGVDELERLKAIKSEAKAS